MYASRALTLTNLQRYDEALAADRKVLELDTAEYGPDHPMVAGDMSNLANVMMMHVSYPEADTLLHQALAIGEHALGPDHPQVATYCNNLVNLYRRQEKWADALPYARRAVAIREKTLPANHPFTARAVMNLATILAAEGNPKQAETMFERGLAMQAKSLPAVHGDIAYARQLHGDNLRALGRLADARDEYARSLELYRKLAPTSGVVEMTDGLYARAIVDAGDPKKGLEEADKALPAALKSDNEVTEAHCRWARADALAALGRTAEAKTEVTTILTALRKQTEPDDVNLANEIEAWAKQARVLEIFYASSSARSSRPAALALLHPEVGELLAQRVAIEAEDLGGLELVAAGVREHEIEQRALDARRGPCRRGRGPGSRRSARADRRASPSPSPRTRDPRAARASATTGRTSSTSPASIRLRVTRTTSRRAIDLSSATLPGHG